MVATLQRSSTERPASSSARWLDTLALAWRRHDTLLYALYAMACTSYAATLFYGYMHVQTGGTWSAPLDDVFIHFDYARAFARGYPFHWSEGNGYSSGNTSLSYPLVLAVGYWLGFRELRLMIWAATVATVSVVFFLLLSRRVAGDDARWVKYLIPPAVLSVGALDWTLFSGMENAFHLATWGLLLSAAVWTTRAPDARVAVRRAIWTGVAGALALSARPESAVCVAVFGVYCTTQLRRAESRIRLGWRPALRVLLGIGAPGVLFLVAHAFANRLLTSEWSANGSIAKLFVNNPFMTAGDKWERYVELLDYIVHRVIEHHLSDVPALGWLVPLVALLPLVHRSTRPLAVALWAQIVLWVLLIGLNNQARWHNERYAMAPLAWLLMLAATGVGRLVRLGPARWTLAPRGAVATALVLTFWVHQAPKRSDQLWFFGRASRNILDQHVTAGMVLHKLAPNRVLVGDAGAMTYISDRPGLDLIGLGGYHDLPFARAGVHGRGASIELVERIPVHDRPEMMALYPSWWGDIPIYFGHYLTAIPVHGNVICGGAEKVLYRARWDALDRSGSPRAIADGERVVDELDIADLVSERAHDYRFPQPSAGYVHYRVLEDPAAPGRDLFDAGRIVPAGRSEHAVLRRPAAGGRLLVRLAPGHRARVRVHVDGVEAGEITAEVGSGTWQEVSLPLPPGDTPRFELTLTPGGGESVHYHLWVIEPAAP